jgi:hypothetical protein
MRQRSLWSVLRSCGRADSAIPRWNVSTKQYIHATMAFRPGAALCTGWSVALAYTLLELKNYSIHHTLA